MVSLILIRIKKLTYFSINKSKGRLGVNLYIILFGDLLPLDELFNIAYTFSNSFG